MKYFTIPELCNSATAKAKGINNSPTSQVEANLIKLVDNVLDPVRELYDGPIKVNSGYRCMELNAAIKGAKNSQHLSGQAADITTGSTDRNRKLFELIRTGSIPFDQLIDESTYSWIHISYSPNPRRQVLHL